MLMVILDSLLRSNKLWHAQSILPFTIMSTKRSLIPHHLLLLDLSKSNNRLRIRQDQALLSQNKVILSLRPKKTKAQKILQKCKILQMIVQVLSHLVHLLKHKVIQLIVIHHVKMEPQLMLAHISTHVVIDRALPYFNLYNFVRNQNTIISNGKEQQHSLKSWQHNSLTLLRQHLSHTIIGMIHISSHLKPILQELKLND